MSKQFTIIFFCSFMVSMAANAQLASERPLQQAYGRQVAQSPAAARTAMTRGVKPLPSEAPMPQPRVRTARPARPAAPGTRLLPSERRETVPPYRKPAKQAG